MFKNVKKEEITIPAQMSYLIQVRDFIEHIGKRYKFDDKIINSFKLVIDEACTNIIRHGYRDIKNGEITIKAIIRRLSLTIIIVDQGQSYDPRQANTPDLAKYVSIGKRGGLGIMMMRKLMDDLQYSVTERGNEFRLTKYREASHETLWGRYWNALNLKTKYSIFAVIIFTVITLIIFLPIYWNAENTVKENAIGRAVSGSQSLAGNVVDDMLAENSVLVFEKAYTLYQSNPEIISEVFVVNDSNQIEGWGDTSKTYLAQTYQIPPQATLVDTTRNTKIYFYTQGDSLALYDLQTDILLGGDVILGQVHVLVKRQTIDKLVGQKKLHLILFLVLILIIGYIPLFFLIHKLLSPFHSLAEWVREVVHGKVDQDEIDIDASDEIGEIAQAFNEMTNKFREAQVTLIEQEKLQKELQVAQQIQQMLLPSDFPKVEGYDISSYYEAAKEVGGDLFDFVEIDDDSVGIIVADVSGKGVPGSLIMTMIRTALRLESRGNRNPADVLARVNQFVAGDMKRGMFVTMFYVVLDSRKRMIHYASAGHNPMILYRGSTKQTYYLNPTGFPVGIQLPDLNLFAKTIQSDSIRLKEDDILVLYTDGITEAMNAKRELYHEERFLDAIRRNAHLDVGEFVKSINGDLKSFTGGAPQNDDITFVAIKEKMRSGEVKYKVLEEMFHRIEKGMKVKDALEQFRITSGQYYTYKEIISRKGMKGLRDYFEGKDTVEKKHISLEVKTKIFDIIRKHPDYGPNLISYELRSETYGHVRMDPDRIYNELIKLRLNTQKLRERYLQKGGKSHIKQPGTPLLTLDGNVIINFESSEQEIAKRRGPENRPSVRKLSEAPKEEPRLRQPAGPTSTEPGSGGTYIHQQARPFKAVPSAPKTEKEKPPKKKTSEPSKNAGISGRPLTKEELIKQVTPEIDPEQLIRFRTLVKEELQTIGQLIEGSGQSEQLDKDIHQINLMFKLILRHPQLKEQTSIRQIFEQMQKVVDTMEAHYNSLEQSVIIANLKDLLIYVAKDNKFKDYRKLYELINKIGLINHRLKKTLTAENKQSTNQFERIRAKLADKKIIENTALLESLEKEKKQ